MNCRQCNNPLPVGAKFCSHCGRPVPGGETEKLVHAGEIIETGYFVRVIDQQADLTRFPMLNRHTTPDRDLTLKAESNSEVWGHFIKERLYDTRRVTLDHFHLFEWFPLSPGRYHTPQAEQSRNDAYSMLERTSDGDTYFNPYGKANMILGGIGAVRLNPTVIAGEEQYFMTASSTGVCHEGFPVLIPRRFYGRVKKRLLDEGAAPVTLRGEMKFMPKDKLPFSGNDRDIPLLYLHVDDIQDIPLPRPEVTEYSVSVAISFEGIFQGNRGLFMTYATFDPASRKDFDEACRWLKEFYVTRQYQGVVVTDFDEQYAHFPEAVFGLPKLMSGRLDPDRIEAFVKDHYPYYERERMTNFFVTLNIGGQQRYGPTYESGSRHIEKKIDTGGGAYVAGNVSTGGGDFVGREKTVHGGEVHGVEIQNIQGGKIEVEGDIRSVGEGSVRGIAIGPAFEAETEATGAKEEKRKEKKTTRRKEKDFPEKRQPLIEEKIRLDVQTPQTVEVQKTFEIGVAIRQPDSQVPIEQDLPKVVSKPGKIFREKSEDIVRYRVKVSAPDCDVHSGEAVFLLRAGTDSETHYFQVTARKPGLISILVQAYQEDGTLAADTRVSITATLEAKEPSPTLEDRYRDKTKILFFASNPQNTSKLSLDEEARSITRKIRESEFRDSLEFVTAWAVRPTDLLDELNLHKPTIIHFSGHGSGEDGLVLTDERGESKLVSTEALKMLFSTVKDNIRMVVLNACFSAVQGQAISEAIECVIGMSKKIGDEAAISFAAYFYSALGFGRSVKEAFDQGKTALMLEGIPEDNTPVLLHKQGVDPATVKLIQV